MSGSLMVTSKKALERLEGYSNHESQKKCDKKRDNVSDDQE